MGNNRIFLKVAVGVAFGCLCVSDASSVRRTGSSDRATRILGTLPGTWNFTLGKASGTRVVKELYAERVVEWSETFDGRDVDGKGFIGYDPQRALFFSMTVHNGPGDYGFMTGQLDPTEDTIVFEPTGLPSESGAFKSIFRLQDADRFTYTAVVKGDDDEWSRAWVASFERQK